MENLSPKERVLLERLAEDKYTIEALRKLFLGVIYEQGITGKDPLNNFALALVASKKDATDEELGSDLRGKWQGINFLESGFEILEKLKKPIEVKKDKPNKGR